MLDTAIMTQSMIIVVLLLVSFFFSGAETALFNLTKAQLEKLRQDIAPSSRMVVNLLKKPKRLLISILTGNTLVNIAIATIGVFMTQSLAEKYHYDLNIALGIETIALTMVLLIVGEVTPKVLAIRRSVVFSSRVAWAMTLFTKLIAPIANILYSIIEKMTHGIGLRPEDVFTSDEEIEALAELSEFQGVIGSEERDMIQSMITFGDTVAKGIMIPRPDMEMLHTKMTRKEVLLLIQTTGFSKYPLYDEQVDNILGIIYIKDLLPYLHVNTNIINLKRLARVALFVPEKLPIDALLREMQRKEQKLALVVDEYGGMAGMVAVEDIIEEVLGDLNDEMDENEPDEIRKIDAETHIIEAATHLEDVGNSLNITFSEERDFDTIGGFIFHQMGQIPSPGDKIEFKGFSFKVISVENQRIVEIRVRSLQKPN